jgi:hypothetical protein
MIDITGRFYASSYFPSYYARMTEYSLQTVKGGIVDRYLLVTTGYGMKTAQFLQAVEGAIFRASIMAIAT